MQRIKSVLVANRGEIACRIIRSARELGIQSIAVFSDDDRAAPHTRLADRAVRLPGEGARDTYLSHDAIVAAARATGADCIHPGYGFLSEDHVFARRCEDEGVTFLGPSSAVIEQMALKDAAKEIAKQAGVPVLEGARISGEDQEEWAAVAAEVGYPVIVKAVAGGGGRGMHVATDREKLVEVVATARREAGSLFGSDELILERYLPAPRHIEIQVVGDTRGNAVHVFERECSIQRRHQKVIEEAPSPALTPELRARMGESAVSLVKALGYVGVGTTEFLLDDSVDQPQHYFLEMNTRLQVEHPVTEEISGLDLVRLQFEVAEGRPLSFSQEDLVIDGHAIEARLYAEDPSDGFSPRPGELLQFAHAQLKGVRHEDGVEGRTTVSPRYDPMLSKVVAHGSSREEATRRLSAALRGLRVHGIATNRDFLVAVLDTPGFVAGETRTDFIDRHPELLASEKPPPVEHLAALVAVRALGNLARSAVPFARPGFRVLPKVWSPLVRYELVNGSGAAYELEYRFEGDGEDLRLLLRIDGDERVFGLRNVDGGSARVTHDGVEAPLDVAEYDDGTAWVNDHLSQSGWRLVQAEDDVKDANASGEVTSSLPGTVVALGVSGGERVDEGQELMVVEAMKMAHPVLAPRAGVIRIEVEIGAFVQAGAVLAEVVHEGEE